MKLQNYHLKFLRQSQPGVKTSIEISGLLFFDLETSGLRPDRGAKITEVSILNRNSQIYYWVRNCSIDFVSISKEIPIILSILNKGVVVGHNLKFDFWFISHKADKIGIEGPAVRFIDTLSLAQKILPGINSYQLTDLLREFDIKINGELHTATTDAAATRALFWKLVEKGGISTVGEAGMKKLNWSSF